MAEPGRALAVVVLGAVDLAARSGQIALEIAAFPGTQAVAAPAVDALLRANRHLVRPDAIELAAVDVAVAHAVADPRRLTRFTRVDAPAMRRLRTHERGRREQTTQRNGGDGSNGFA